MVNAAKDNLTILTEMIRISKTTKQKLEILRRHERETYDDIIVRLIK